MTDKVQETKESKGPMERLMDVTKELVFVQKAKLCWDIRAAWDRSEPVETREVETLGDNQLPPLDDPRPLATLTLSQVHHLDRLHMMHSLGYLDPVAIVNLTPLSAMTLKAESGDAFYTRLLEGYRRAVADKEEALEDNLLPALAAHQADATGTP
tara:strand:- start:98 stop:562 length:465 start_codon:yes stop_codon:yes gene_type:complete